MTRLNFQSQNSTRLLEFLNQLSRTWSYGNPAFHLESGHVFVDGKRCRKPDYKLNSKARIVVHDVESARKPKIRYLTQNDHFLVVNKVAGDHVNQTETTANYSVIEAVQEEFPEAKLIHRLDKETSGVLLIGRGARNSKSLSQCFEQRTVKKAYLAIVEGEIDAKLTLDGSLAKDPRNSRNYRVHASGKSALTEIVRLRSSKEVSVVSAFPLTGRTHQIRVHLADAGFPILGDRQYGGPTAVRVDEAVTTVDRVMLHALGLRIPARNMPWSKTQSSDYIDFFAPCPPDMVNYGCEELALETRFQ